MHFMVVLTCVDGFCCFDFWITELPFALSLRIVMPLRCLGLAGLEWPAPWPPALPHMGRERSSLPYKSVSSMLLSSLWLAGAAPRQGSIGLPGESFFFRVQVHAA